MTRVLLIDGDVLAYAAASKAEKAYEWEPGEWTTHANMDEAKANVMGKLEDFQNDLKGDEVRIALTDSVNFRKDVLPTYKSNRSDKPKPIILKAVRQWMLDELKAVIVPTLEGDDVMGIWATHKAVKGEKIIVSIDKDMKTIPGLVYRPGIDDAPVLISEAEADRNHMIQTLSGDATDGYDGCPGVGKKGAPDIVDNPRRLIKVSRVLKSGPRKGERVYGWEEGDACDVWQAVIDQFAKAGFGPEEALVQARVARICRATDYDSKQKKVILWQPNK